MRPGTVKVVDLVEALETVEVMDRVEAMDAVEAWRMDERLKDQFRTRINSGERCSKNAKTPLSALSAPP